VTHGRRCHFCRLPSLLSEIVQLMVRTPMLQ
jgi:hypothetical protein